MVSSRKSYNLAKAKLALYEKWYRRMGRFSGKVQTPNGLVSARAVREHKKSKARARKYFSEMLDSYHRIDLPLSSDNLKIASHLNTIDDLAKTVYVMKTGFGKGISFSDSQISRILRTSKAMVQESFDLTSSTLRVYFEEWQGPEAGDFIIEVAGLTPELINHLQRRNDLLEELSWQLYEQLVAEFFASWGYQVSLVGRNPSTSADIIAIRPSDQSGIVVKCFIEVKKWKSRVGVETINQVLGSIYSERVNQGFHVGVIVASNGFQDLRKFQATSLNYLGLELRDGEDVKRWLRDYSPSQTGLWLRT